MNKVVYTPSQQEAITTHGKNLLVSAGAGSGKTTVLVRRIICWLNDGGSLDRLLALTFTNAAAADMRIRIAEALQQAIAADPDNLHLSRQAALVQQAHIGTIHSFCLDLLRSHYYQIGLPAGFKVAGELDSQMMRNEVMEEMLEQEYADPSSCLSELADRYGGSHSDKELVNLIYKLYDFCQSRPNPSAWLQEAAAGYLPQDSLDHHNWAQFLSSDIAGSISGIAGSLQQAVRLDGVPQKWRQQLEEERQALLFIAQHGVGLTERLQRMRGMSWERLKPVGKAVCDFDENGEAVNPYDDLARERFKNYRDAAKKDFKDLSDRCAMFDPNDVWSDLTALFPLVNGLCGLVMRFGEMLAARKQIKAVVDFADMEHMALKLLALDEVAEEMHAQFDEVLIDEYQDINEVQEAILKQLAAPGRLFAVGDVKQSIYRFRLAEPGLFLDKYERYGCHQGGSRIDLNENFRSSKTIINGVNYLFRQMMSRNVMEIDYDTAAEMKPGLSERGVPVSVLLLDRDALSQNAEAASAAESAFSGEIRMVADQIAQLHEQGYAYSDMAILLRSSRKNEPIVVDTLAAMGIPADAQTGHDYTDSAEIELVLSILQIIDNPRQDIHLVAVLRSALFDFGPDDLVELRLQDKKAAFIDVLYMISGQNSTVALKSRAFLQTLEEWRSLAAQTKVSELLLHIYHGSGLYNLMGALPDGQRRQANMRMLFERACQYEMNNYAGLFRFIKLIEDGRSFNVAGGYSHLSADRLDSVQVMSIHKSKGLEFPVVFVVGLNAQFNVRDEYADIIFQRDLGIGLRCVDTQRRYKYSSLVHWAIAQRQHEQSLAEEMRILYVALTRAKERLFLSAGVKTLDKRLDQWAADGMTESLCLPDHVLSAARCALDWLMPALLRHADAKLLRDRLIEAPQLIDDESRFDFCICDKLPDLQSTSSQSDFSAADSADLSAQMYEQVKNILGYTYPYKKNCNYPAKWSVSRLNRLPVPPEDVPETALLLSDEANAAVCNSSLEQISKGEELPKQHSISISADMRGTAYHRVLELLDLSRTAPEQIEEQVLQMCSSGKLSPQQAAAVRTDRIIRFFSTREGRQLAAASQVQRETAFTMTMPLDEQERVVVQGVLDVAYRVDNGWVLLDYKTGCYGKSDEELFVLYGKQMAYYCQAIERLWREPVQAAYLCLLDLGRNLLIPVEYLK